MKVGVLVVVVVDVVVEVEAVDAGFEVDAGVAMVNVALENEATAVGEQNKGVGDGVYRRMTRLNHTAMYT